jgi:hypothetical protein
MISRKTNGLFLFKTLPKFEREPVVLENLIATSFTINIKMITPMAPGIKEPRHIPRMSIV